MNDVQIIRVGVADHHAAVLAGLEAVFSIHPDIYLAGKAADGDEALQLVKSRELDVLVLDLSMLGADREKVLMRLNKIAPDCRVVIYSAFSEQQFAPTLYRVGAKAFVDKATPVQELLSAIRVVATGGNVFSSGVESLLMNLEAEAILPITPVAFTNREFQIFLKLAAGRGPSEVARELNVSIQTVSVYRSKILKRLGFTSVSDLTRYAIENGFLQGSAIGTET